VYDAAYENPVTLQSNCMSCEDITGYIVSCETWNDILTLCEFVRSALDRRTSERRS